MQPITEYDLNADQLIGEGEFSQVYQIEDRNTGETLACKVLRERHCHSPDVLQAFRAEQDLQREIATATEHVVPVIETGKTLSGRPYTVMPFFPSSLRAFVDDTKVKSVSSGSEYNREVLQVLDNLAVALDEFHQAGYIHADLKPTNILLSSENQPYLCDFGLSDRATFNLSRNDGTRIMPALEDSAIKGTFAYMAPEIFEGARPDRHSDLYSFATIFWECIYQDAPFPVQEHDTPVTYAYRKTHQAPIAPLKTSVPGAVKQVLNRGLRIEPQLRFTSAVELLQEVEKAWRNPSYYVLRDPAPSLAYVLSGFGVILLLVYLLVTAIPLE